MSVYRTIGFVVVFCCVVVCYFLFIVFVCVFVFVLLLQMKLHHIGNVRQYVIIM